MLLSEPLLGEVLGVLGRKFDHSKDELARVALLLDDLADRISPRSRLAVLEDEPDSRILELAVDGHADVIVTGDRAMLRLGTFRGIQILSLRDFLTRIGVAPAG